MDEENYLAASGLAGKYTVWILEYSDHCDWKG